MDCGSIGIGFDSGISKDWDGRFDDFKIFHGVQSIFLGVLLTIWSHSSGVSVDLSRNCRLWRSWYETKEVLLSWTGFDFCLIIDGCWITSGCCWTIGCCWKAWCSGLDIISPRITLLRFPSGNVAWKEPFRIASSRFF